jgi:uncharacterized protein
MNDLLAKLKSQGLIIPKSEVKTKLKRDFPLLEEFYNGFWITNPFGRVFCIKETMPYGSRFGIINFRNDFSTREIIDLTGCELSKNTPLEKIVFLDIETTSFSIGAGSIAFLIGLCYFSSSGVQTVLLFIEDPIDEPALLICLEDELNKFEIISSYNGKSFDVPLLKNRFIMQKNNPISLQKFHIDLLHLSRNIWKARINNCRLADIEREILKYDRSDFEIPGWQIPQIYFDYLENKDPLFFKGVFYHNKIDVLSLAALFQYIATSININLARKSLEGLDLASVGKIYQKLGEKELSQAYYGLSINKGLDRKNIAFVHRNIGFLKKKQYDWRGAVDQWKEAAKYNDVDSCIELAKYFEHQVKDYYLALEWTNKALIFSSQISSAKLSKLQNEDKIFHRKNRLIGKIKSIDRK